MKETNVSGEQIDYPSASMETADGPMRRGCSPFWTGAPAFATHAADQSSRNLFIIRANHLPCDLSSQDLPSLLLVYRLFHPFINSVRSAVPICFARSALEALESRQIRSVSKTKHNRNVSECSSRQQRARDTWTAPIERIDIIIARDASKLQIAAD